MSWFFLLIAYIITDFSFVNRFWSYVAWAIAIFMFIIYISLKKVEFTKNAIFFNNKKVKFESIIDLKMFEIKHIHFYLFKTNSENLLKRYYLTQIRGIGYFSIIKILFSKKSGSKLPHAEFLNVLDEKSNISKN